MTDEVIEYVPRLLPGNGQHQSQFGSYTLDTLNIATTNTPSFPRIDDGLITVATMKRQLLCDGIETRKHGSNRPYTLQQQYTCLLKLYLQGYSVGTIVITSVRRLNKRLLS